MTFDPENPRTEDREFHLQQENLDNIILNLEQITISDGLDEFPNEEAKEKFRRDLEIAEEQLRNIRERMA